MGGSDLKIAIVYNDYLSHTGEASVVQNETELLRSKGHEVQLYRSGNDNLEITSLTGRVRSAVVAAWSTDHHRRFSSFLADFRPDIVHVHNTFAAMSPSVIWAAKRAGVPVVHTFHNYRMTCANGLLYRDGLPCENCVGGSKISALRYSCYRDSAAATAAVVGMQGLHGLLGTYTKQLDAVIVLSEFAKDIFVRAGIPAYKLHVKTNFVHPQVPSSIPIHQREKKILFVGRIVPEKGLDILLKAWAQAGIAKDWKLVIVGDGPERPRLMSDQTGLSNVTWKSWVSSDELIHELRTASYLVMASRWYEGLPMVILEAYTEGTPVLVPRIGALGSVLPAGPTTFFEPSSVESLADALMMVAKRSEPVWKGMSTAAVDASRTSFSPDANYDRLLEIYRHVIRTQS